MSDTRTPMFDKLKPQKPVDASSRPKNILDDFEQAEQNSNEMDEQIIQPIIEEDVLAMSESEEAVEDIPSIAVPVMEEELEETTPEDIDFADIVKEFSGDTKISDDATPVTVDADELPVVDDFEEVLGVELPATEPEVDLAELGIESEVSELDLPQEKPEQVKLDDEDPDWPKMIVVPLSNTEVIVKGHTELAMTMTPQEYENAAHDNPEMVRLMREGNFLNPEQIFSAEAVAAALNNNGTLTRSWKDDETGKIYGPATMTKKQAKALMGTEISKANIGIFVAAMTNGVKQVYLPNSGFYVYLRAPKNTELDVYYTNAFRSYYEYGRVLGQYYFLPADLEIKKIFLDLLPNWIVSCNLENWETDLLDHLKFPDLKVLFWAIATLMHPDGVDIDFSCRADNCPRPRQTVKTDVNQMIFFNYTAMSLEAKRFLYSSKVKTAADLAKYHEMLGFNKEVTLFDEWVGSTQVPSMTEYIEYTEAFNSDLASHIQVTSEDDVVRYLSYSKNQSYTPWFKSIQCVDAETGKSGTIKDRETLPETIGQLQTVSPDKIAEFFDNMKKYIAEISLSFIGYSYSHCPACNTKVESAVGGLIPCDIQSTFFYLSVIRLGSL